MAKDGKPVVPAKTEAAPSRGGLKNRLFMGLIGVVAAAAGFAVPQLLGGGAATSHKTEEHKSETMPESASPQPVFLPFGELVVNLAEERLTRYLRVSITLQVERANEETAKQGIEKKKTILKNWLISYLSDKSLEEVRGAAGVNRARREIQDQFNNILFPDGSEIIREVLFEEFSVQ